MTNLQARPASQSVADYPTPTRPDAYMPSLAASVACGSGRPAFCACGQTALNVVDGVGFCKDHRAEAVAAQTAKSNLESARVQAGYAAHSRRRISFHLRSVSIQAGV